MNELWVTVKRISKLTNISLKMSNLEKKTRYKNVIQKAYIWINYKINFPQRVR